MKIRRESAAPLWRGASDAFVLDNKVKAIYYQEQTAKVATKANSGTQETK